MLIRSEITLILAGNLFINEASRIFSEENSSKGLSRGGNYSSIASTFKCLSLIVYILEL